MRDFDHRQLPTELMQPDIANMVSAIHEYRGKQDLYLEAKADEAPLHTRPPSESCSTCERGVSNTTLIMRRPSHPRSVLPEQPQHS